MTNFELKELRSVASELLSDSANHVNQLSESDMNNIYGGIDLEEPAKQIFGIIGDTAGDALTTGLVDLFF